MAADLQGDGGLLKEVLVEGTGEDTPQPGDSVSVHYVGTLQSDGSKFDSSRDRDAPFEFKLGQSQVIKGWDHGVATMKLGEKAMFTIRADYGYGDSGSPPKIPGGATLMFEVELLSWKDGSWEEVYTTDGAVTVKMTTASDSWLTPEDFDEVELKYTGRNGDTGVVVQEQGEFTTVVLGRGVLPSGVEAAIKQKFKKGTAGVVKVGPGEWCNHQGGEERVGPLEYEVELERFYKRADVYNDGGVVVKCTTETDGYAKPTDGSICTFEMEGRDANDGTVFEEKCEKTISVGESVVCGALEEALTHVTTGQEAEVAIDARYGPDGRAVVYWVHLKDVKSVYSLSFEEKISGSSKRKELGNDKLKAGDLDGAKRSYDAAFKLIEHEAGEEDQDKQQLNGLKLSIHLNLSLVLQKLGNEPGCIDECKKALDLDAANVKAIYRCGAAQLKKGELQEAEKMFVRLQEIDPELKEASLGLAQVKKKQKQMDKKDKALFAKMMSGVGKGRDEPPPAPAEPEASSETSGDADTAPVDV